LIKKAASTTPENPGPTQTVELLQRRWLSKSAFEIELTRPPAFNFKAGQTICFIHESMERYYSLLSTPDDPTLTLCVYHVPQGSFSPILADSKIGNHFKVRGPHGYFTFNRSERSPVFVATGTGIAPFVSMGRSGITDFILLHEVELVEELYYRDLFYKIASNFVPCLQKTSSPGPLPSGAFDGNAAGFLKKNLAPDSYDFYLCGEREMIRGVTLLVDERFAGSRVYTEVFY
jgi:benzoate/toluate 1,2-dioxygenase reductase subunit